METKIEKDTIAKILEFLVKKGKNSKYINILSALCICKDKPMIKNQRELSIKILKDPLILKYFLFEMSMDEMGIITLKN